MTTKLLPIILAALTALAACGVDVDLFPDANANVDDPAPCEVVTQPPVRKTMIGLATCNDDGFAVFVDEEVGGGGLVPRDVRAWATDFDGDGGDAGRTSAAVNVSTDGHTAAVDCATLPTWADGVELYAFGPFPL